MSEVFDYILECLQKLLLEFKIANAVIHLDEASPHMHVVGVPVWEGAKRGLSKKVSKRNIFTPQILSVILQDKLRAEASYGFECYFKEQLAEKKKGRNDYQLEQPVKTSDGAYIQLCYTRKLPGRNKLLEYEKRYLRMNIRKISDREVVIDIRQQSSIDSKNALKFIETISKGDSTLNLRHINLELLNGKNKIEFFDRIAAYTFGMWRLKTITGITVKQGTIEEDEEDEEVRIDDENEASTLSGISQAVLNGSGLRSNEFVQESINKGYYISAMRYRYEHKQDATEFAVVLSFKNQDLRVDIDKTYLEEEGRIYVQPFVKAEQNEIVVKFQDAAYKIFGELLEMQNAE